MGAANHDFRIILPTYAISGIKACCPHCQLSKLCEKIIQNFIQKTLKHEWQHNRMNGYTKGFGHSKLKTTDLWIDAVSYRKIPKISPEAYIFQRPFLRGLLLEGLIFGRAYARSEICLSKSIKVACSGKEIYHVCFVLLCIRGQIPSTSPPGGLYLEGRFNGGFLRYDFGGLIYGGGYFRNFIVCEFIMPLLWELVRLYSTYDFLYDLF